MDAGKITLGELLQIQAQIADAQGELLGAQNSRETAALNICQMLEIGDSEPFLLMMLSFRQSNTRSISRKCGNRS